MKRKLITPPSAYLISGLPYVGKTRLGYAFLKLCPNFVFIDMIDYINMSENKFKTFELSNGINIIDYYSNIDKLFKWKDLNDTVKMYLSDGWNVLIAGVPHLSKYVNFSIDKSILLAYEGTERNVIDICLKKMCYNNSRGSDAKKSLILELIELIIPSFNNYLLDKNTEINSVVYVTNSTGGYRYMSYIFKDVYNALSI